MVYGCNIFFHAPSEGAESNSLPTDPGKLGSVAKMVSEFRQALFIESHLHSSKRGSDQWFALSAFSALPATYIVEIGTRSPRICVWAVC